MVPEEEAQGVAYGLVSAVVRAPFNELVQELHVPLGQPDGDPLPLSLLSLHLGHRRCIRTLEAETHFHF